MFSFFSALLSIAVVGCEFADFYIVDGCYSSGKDVLRRPGQRTWFPPWIESADNLCERHSGDTNELWAQWTFEPHELNQIVSHAKEIPLNTVKWPRDPNRFRGEKDVHWWTFEADRKKSPLRYFRVEGQHDGYVGVNFNSGVVYYWRLSG